MGKRVFYAIVDSLAVSLVFLLVCLFCLGIVVVLHWEGYISAEPVLVALNHVIDGVLEDLFWWLLK